MPNFTEHILTNGGRALIAQAHLGRKLTFTKIAVGSGNQPNPAQATALAAHRMDVEITSIQRDSTNANWVRVRGMFTNVSLATGFAYREMGLFARIDSGPEVLYSYVADAGAGDLIPAYDGANPVIIYPTMIIIIESTIPIHADITIGGDVDATNIGTSTVEGWFAQKVGNILEFKRPVAGNGIELTEDASTITIGQRILRLDLDLYVPTTHPNAPNSNVAFSTIPDALAFLDPITIPAGRQATIHIAAGTYNYAAAIVVNHPNGDRIRIVGANPDTRTLTARGAISGSAGAFTEELIVNSGTGIAANDYVLVSDTWGSGDDMSVRGFWLVQSASATAVTVLNTRARGFATMNYTGGSVSKIATLLSFPGSSAFITRGGGLGLLNNVGLVGPVSPTTQYGITCEANTVLGARVGIRRFGIGIFAQRAGVTCEAQASISACSQMGVACLNGASVIFSGASNGNTLQGAQCGDGGLLNCDRACLSGNGTAGFDVFRSQGSANLAQIMSNGGRGLSGQNGSTIGANELRIGNNGGADAYALYNSFIGMVGYTTLAGWTMVFNPVAEGNTFSYINR